MPHPLLLFHLLPGHLQVFGVADEDVVAAVGCGMVDGLVLAEEEGGDAGG